ncbi:DUF6083 domain-containing protein [Streptomyces sp. NPDC048644]|uniref:DUF6083 domain-containing protein n=1 Tax=Streptomyces sp. NPDC048644 TaxID=3365582 RepID=UPI0037103875
MQAPVRRSFAGGAGAARGRSDPPGLHVFAMSPVCVNSAKGLTFRPFSRVKSMRTFPALSRGRSRCGPMNDGKGFNWDGSRQDAWKPHNMRVWSSSASKTLRRNAQDQCVYCGHKMEYFDRFDGGRIPMVPMALPAAKIPPRHRWHVDNGVAYKDAASRGTCRLPHPTVCPMAEHTDGDEELDSVRRTLAVRTRMAIDAKTFVPRESKTLDEDEVAEQHITVAEGAERHIARHSTRLWLAPTTIQDLRCVARAGTDRCSMAVRAEDSPEGAWEEIDIPPVPGRAGQQVLAAGSTMWVWVLNVLDYDSLERWVKQRCFAHWNSSAPDAEAPE